MMSSPYLLAAGFGLGAICATLAHRLLTRASRSASRYGPAQRQAPTADWLSDPQYVELKNQQLARVIKFFGEQKFCRLEESFVVVFGVGGVGSHVVNMLARSGVRRIRIIDFDTVSMSSLNRHSFALREDVGTPKVECIRKYVGKILPHIVIECVNMYATVDNVRALLIGDYKLMQEQLDKINKGKDVGSNGTNQLAQDLKPDYIVDCIDNLDAKVELISACVEKKLRLIVSGGAGMKSDPTKLQIRDIADCKYDKLIMRLKRELTKKSIKTGIKVCYSYQQADKELLPLTQTQESNPEAFKVFDNYRIRIIPVLGTMPAIIGMSIASYVLCQLAEQPYEPFETDYVKSSSISKMYNQIQYYFKRTGRRPEDLQVDIEEVSILAKKIYNWKCLVTPEAKGDRLVIWDPAKKGTIDNLVLMCKDNAEKHPERIKLLGEGYSQQVLTRYALKAQEAIRFMNSGQMMFI